MEECPVIRPESAQTAISVSETAENAKKRLPGSSTFPYECDHWVPPLSNGVFVGGVVSKAVQDDKLLWFRRSLGETCLIHADPRHSGHAGFFYDGDEIHYNLQGGASKNNETLTERQLEDLVDKGTTTK